jgi:hypothetical protein
MMGAGNVTNTMSTRRALVVVMGTRWAAALGFLVACCIFFGIGVLGSYLTGTAYGRKLGHRIALEQTGRSLAARDIALLEFNLEMDAFYQDKPQLGYCLVKIAADGRIPSDERDILLR